MSDEDQILKNVKVSYKNGKEDLIECHIIRVEKDGFIYAYLSMQDGSVQTTLLNSSEVLKIIISKQ